MRVKELENVQNKSGLKGCKWSSLNAPGTENPLSHSGWENSLFSFSWGIKEMNGLLIMEVNTMKHFRTSRKRFELLITFYPEPPLTYTYVKKSQRIGCVIPRCNLLRGITQPIIRILWHICTIDMTVNGGYFLHPNLKCDKARQFFSSFAQKWGSVDM